MRTRCNSRRFHTTSETRRGISGLSAPSLRTAAAKYPAHRDQVGRAGPGHPHGTPRARRPRVEAWFAQLGSLSATSAAAVLGRRGPVGGPRAGLVRPTPRGVRLASYRGSAMLSSRRVRSLTISVGEQGAVSCQTSPSIRLCRDRESHAQVPESGCCCWWSAASRTRAMNSGVRCEATTSTTQSGRLSTILSATARSTAV